MDKYILKRYILLITADEWNHDADEWLGIYISDEEVMAAYKRAAKWFQEECSYGRYCSSQRVVIYEFDVQDDVFREIDPEKIS